MNTTYKNTLSSIMNRAWMMVKTYGISLSEALRKAWAIAKLRKAMKSSIVRFMYQKLDGTIRTAWGTLKESVIPAPTTDRKPNPTVVTYYDNEKQSYRSFKAINIIL